MLGSYCNSADLRFAEGELVPERVELFSAKELAAAALGVDNEAFVHLAFILEATNIHPSRQAQIASLNVKEVTIPAEYSDYTDVFSSDSAAELPEHTGINDHPIDLVDNKQPPYSPIYSLGLVELVRRAYTAAEALPSWSKCRFRQKERICQSLSTFHPGVQQDRRPTHFDAQDELINRLIN